MAAGDPYFDCDNNKITTEQVIRAMIMDDGEGNPVWTTNLNTILENWFNCDERKNMTTEQVIRKMIVQDSEARPIWNVSTL